MKKHRNFKEIKRTPHYGIRKLNVGVASVLLGVTIFGVNMALDPAKAAADTTTPTAQSASPMASVNNTNSNEAVLKQVTPTSNTTNESATPADTTKLAKQDTNSTSNTNSDTTVSKQATSTTASAPVTTNTQEPVGSDRNSSGTVDENNINTQTQEKNNQLAKETGLTSSDNSSSNIYQGKDGNYYKIITIYGKDYVYRPVKVYANGTATGQWATNERDTQANIVMTKEDLGNGKVKWIVTFFPAKGLTKPNSAVSGLQSAKFGIALTKDYKIIGDVTVTIDSTGTPYIAMDGHGNETAFTPETHVIQSFDPINDVGSDGWINSDTMPGENNNYILGPYYFTTDSSTGKQNLGNTFFKEDTVYKNVYTSEDFIGELHDLWTDNYIIKNESKNALDGGEYYKKHLIYDPLYNGRNVHTDGFFNSDDFGSAMIFKSHGKTGTGKSQNSSYTISFVTQHTDSYQGDLPLGPNGQQFSGILANTYSYQNAYYNMYSMSLGEQRSLKLVDGKYQPTTPEDVVSNWEKGKEALAKINQEYLNKSQIDVLENAIHSNIDNDNVIEQIITTGNDLNNAMKTLGNSLGQYDDNSEYTDHVVDTVKMGDRYLNADPAKKTAYNQAVEDAQKIIDKDKGQYAEQDKVEELTKAVNEAWKALNGSTIPTQKVIVRDPKNLTSEELAQIKQRVNDVNPGTNVEIAKDGSVTITLGDNVLTPIAGNQLIIGQTKVNDPQNLTPNEQDEVKQKVTTAYKTLGVTDVTIDQDGTATITIPSGQVKIPGNDLVVPKTNAEKYTPEEGNVTADNGTTLQKGMDLTEDQLKTAIPNHADLPDGTKYTWKDTTTVSNDTTTATIVVTYPDTTSEEVRVSITVKGTNADTNEPNVPKDKVKVDDKNNLTEDEKNEVKDKVNDANKDESGKSTLPDGTDISVDDKGNVTITYPDGSKDTILGDKVVEEKTDAEKNNPNVPEDKVKVDDPNNLTEDEKNEVKDKVNDANKDESGKSTLPDGTDISVDDKGNVTITYPDGSKDTIPGDKVVEEKTDADKNNPNVPEDKVKVDDPNNLTEDEKNEVKDKVNDANKDESGKSTLPDGTDISVDDKGNVTITYPDGSKDTILGDKVVEEKNDADKYPLNPGQAVDVDDTSHLTSAEQESVKDAIRTANPTAPIAMITVDATGNVTVIFADGSTTTFRANLRKRVSGEGIGTVTKPNSGTDGGQTNGSSTDQGASKKQKLPHTGDQPETIWAVLSGLGLAFLGLLGFKKKREE